VGIEPTADEIAACAAAAARADATVLLLFDAHLYASNRKLLEAVTAAAPGRCGAVLLRDPYDAALLPTDVVAVTAYGFRRCQLDAAIARLLSAS
jgi:hypothetical protein